MVRAEGVGVTRSNVATESHPPSEAQQSPMSKPPTTEEKGLALKEAKCIDFEAGKAGICRNVSAQPNSAVRQDSIEILPHKDTSAESNDHANAVYCKVMSPSGAEADSNQDFGKSTAEQNNAKSSWITKSQSTVVLGTDGNAAVLPVGASGVSVSRRQNLSSSA
uniref:Uncharacterized protein n=1 Tax=Callorhinchus milii TaxID=7868 RepID=A0A4W3K791_CALMI